MDLEQQDHVRITQWAADCAERALPLFERDRPDDSRPREAIEAARSWARGESTVSDARAAAFAAHAAARDVGTAAARAAARAAGHAAATAHVVGHARHAADYAATAAGASVEASETAMATAAEREWQFSTLPPSLRPLAFGRTP